MFRSLSRLTLVTALLGLAACTVDENGNIVMPPPSASAGSVAKPRISQAGTCFMFVTEEPGGKYTLTTGIGDGSANPVGEARKGLSASALDARYASELAVMNISPECLSVLAADRSAARPAPKVAPKVASKAGPAKPAVKTAAK